LHAEQQPLQPQQQHALAGTQVPLGLVPVPKRRTFDFEDEAATAMAVSQLLGQAAPKKEIRPPAHRTLAACWRSAAELQTTVWDELKRPLLPFLAVWDDV
jgi:hypothetical protein